MLFPPPFYSLPPGEGKATYPEGVEMIELTTPVSGEQIRKLHAGDRVRISGVAVTGRDAAHKYMVEKLIEGAPALSAGDRKLYDELSSILRGGAIYHCGPIVRREGEKWSFLSAGPTTSIRDEIYQDKVIKAFGVRFVIGKGGMGPRTLAAGDKLHGFQVLRVETIEDIRVRAYEMEHEATGAKVLHLHCDDRENLYAIGFRTPPDDSTGVPHILEHSVLAGSEKYPVKDAFNELHKGTMQTFINAFTYPDKTIYPVASQTRTDFFNLARVYTDLVLKPRLLRESFYQEGHHLEVTA